MPSRLSIRLYVTSAMTRLHEPKPLVVLPSIMPPREKTVGWKRGLLVGRWRILRSATESKYLSTSRVGFSMCSARVVALGSLLTRKITVRSYPALAKPMAGGPTRTDDLEVIVPAYLVAGRLKPHSSEGGGGKGLFDDASGDVVPCHLPGLPLETDLGGGRKDLPPRSGYSGPHVHRVGCVAVERRRPQSR